ncbi:hypothetical protein BU17DRAFT_71895 [Hysterangium stoloniferum]|nr:hypothetical protein BU17DRAFT_71895 [Hysterangium stoloniferum]
MGDYGVQGSTTSCKYETPIGFKGVWVARGMGKLDGMIVWRSEADIRADGTLAIRRRVRPLCAPVYLRNFSHLSYILPRFNHQIPGLPGHYDYEWHPQDPRSPSRIPWVIHKGALSLSCEAYERINKCAVHEWFVQDGRHFFRVGVGIGDIELGDNANASRPAGNEYLKGTGTVPCTTSDMGTRSDLKKQARCTADPGTRDSADLDRFLIFTQLTVQSLVLAHGRGSLYYEIFLSIVTDELPVRRTALDLEIQIPGYICRCKESINISGSPRENQNLSENIHGLKIFDLHGSGWSVPNTWLVTGADLVADFARSGLPPLSQEVKRGSYFELEPIPTLFVPLRKKLKPKDYAIFKAEPYTAVPGTDRRLTYLRNQSCFGTDKMEVADSAYPASWPFSVCALEESVFDTG